MANDEQNSGDEARRDANAAMGTGFGIGALGVASATLLGAVCPICVVAAPALIGYGVFKRIQCARTADDAVPERETQALEGVGDSSAG